MKHLFIINPYAGKTNDEKEIESKLNASSTVFDHEIHLTTGPGEATMFVERWCDEHEDEVRFYACGGDGTINEVATGVVKAKECHPGRRIEMSCFPCGSGNDYVKYYQGDWRNIEDLVEGEPHKVDVMKVNDRYCINVCNFGFDAMVCKTMIEVKRKPIIGGRHAYTTGVVKGLFGGRSNYCRVATDGKPFHNGKMLLCTVSNGKYVGGSYQCAPKSENDDGMVEVLLFKPIRLASILSLISVYKNGKQFETPRIFKKMKYTRAKEVVVEADKDFDLCIDGEMLRNKHFEIRNLQQAITFVSPKTAQKQSI